MKPFPDEVLRVKQRDIVDVAAKLARLNHSLVRITKSLHLPSDIEEQFEGRTPMTPVAALYSSIEAARESMREALRLLWDATEIDEVSLRRQFRPGSPS